MKTALGAALCFVVAAVLGSGCGPLGGGCKRLGCANGRVCNEATDTCEKGGGSGGGTGTGGGLGGGSGGGAGGGGGGSGGGGGGSGGSGGSGGGGGTMLYPDGGFPNCLTRAVGARTCTTDCPPGFHCQSGECRLNGGDAPLQVTLRWDTFEDLDLHVIEPVQGSDAGTDGGVDGGTDAGSGNGTCEVYYGDRNTATTPSACGALGSLDLDSEPGCPTPPDGVEIENVVYPNTRSPVPGTYVVRVSHYRACAVQLQQAGYMVEVRKGTQVTGLCGVFLRTDPDFGMDQPRTVMTFTWP